MKARPPAAGGEVVSAHGRHYVVRLDEGSLVHTFPRAKKSLVACGDRVLVGRTGADQAVIEAVDPRSTLLYRSNQHREKLLAANVSQIAIVVAGTPSFYDELVTRCLVAAAQQGLRSVIVLNKSDLARESAIALRRLDVYRSLGYVVLALSAKGDVSPLRAYLSGERTLLVGQSGMGKSTLVNALVPDAQARVGEVSTALDSGRHTTTFTRLYRLNQDTALIDSPGLQEFGIAHLSHAELVRAFPEFQPFIGACRFTNCRHLAEPGCAITAAGINAERLRIYQKLAEELRSVGSY